ncbi:MAG TPA: hypothetical protein VLW85_11135 [Myxococcales bacterium]|nr:hypothetical protein [Myxococcales bacterium]
MRPILVAALALLCACAGYTNGEVLLSDAGGPPVGGGSGGNPDSGPTDAGPTDAGPTDAGSTCTPLAVSEPIIDGCESSSALSGTASVSVGANCAVSITLSTGISCTGTAQGTNDQFQGACGGFPLCGSPSIPGSISCGSCSIVICNGSCP